VVLQDIQIILQREQLLFEAYLRYYDLLSHSENTSDLKRHRKLRKSIGLAKQKLIFYLSFLKSEHQNPKGMWSCSDVLGCQEFVSVFVNDKIYHRVTNEERTKLHATLKDSKYI